MNQIPALIRVFAYLSLLTVGGGMAAFPELKILTVEVHKWLTFPQLIHLYSVGQMAPGPNMMMIVAIGQWATRSLDHRLDSKVNESMTNPHMTYFSKVGHARCVERP